MFRSCVEILRVFELQRSRIASSAKKNQVDFNAGVVAAGEAQIESTVTGNASAATTTGVDAALRDQSQIYLPINRIETPTFFQENTIEDLK